MNYKHVLAVDGRNIHDTINPHTGRTRFGGLTPDQAIAANPDLKHMEFDAWVKLHDETWDSGPVEIDEKEFDRMLNVLPPEAWVRREQTESFRCAEFQSALHTNHYVRIGERYFQVCRNARKVNHDSLVELCQPLLSK